MKNKNGFVFIETMVTVVILVTALLSLYTLFTNVLVREKRRIYYDDPIYTYRANYLSIIFEKVLRVNSSSVDDPSVYIKVSDLLTTYDDQGQKIEYNLKGISCDNDLFLGTPKDGGTTQDNNEAAAKKAACVQFFSDNNIYRIYVSRYDLSYIKNCQGSQRNTSLCLDYNNLSSQAKGYFKQLHYIPDVDGYYIIFEFNESGNGTSCTKDNCMHQFASVKYGGINDITNYND